MMSKNVLLFFMKQTLACYDWPAVAGGLES